MKIVITDSGLGGLSVAAELYETLKVHKYPGATELIFVNALPETGKGYNKMRNTEQKIRIFNNVLHGIARRFDPDIIAIACNTLSVIVAQTRYYRGHKQQITGIVESGINSFLSGLKPDNAYYVIIFGTETTIEAGVHRKKLIELGIPERNIITQSCSGLAAAIERDYKGAQTHRLVSEYVELALIPVESKHTGIYAYLACTHYGYIIDEFTRLLQQSGFKRYELFNPNHSLVNLVLEKIRSAHAAPLPKAAQVSIQIYARCAILPEEIISISGLIKNQSHPTAMALQNYQIEANLFNPD